MAPALGLALVVVALFVASLLAIVLSMQLLLHHGLQLVTDAMNL